MTLSRGRATAAVSLALLLSNACVPPTLAQSASDTPATATSPPSTLDLTPEKVSHLKTALAAHDYLDAEKLLINEIEPDPHSPRAAPLLAYLGSVYFLNHDYLNAAVAWKKSDTIRPLEAGLQFSLAMAYVRISRPDWAHPLLESLSPPDANNARYPYSLDRLAYDAHQCRHS